MTADINAVLAELQALRAEVAELRRELAEIRGIASEAGDHALHVRNLIDSSDGEIL
ncbi:MAG: hypothetical protein AB7I50_25400 [Vicinamibacterales bacterium]